MIIRNVLFTIAALLLLFSAEAKLNAQTTDGIRQTWKGPDLSLIKNVLKESGNKRASGSSKARVAVLTFKPAGVSGVAASLAAALGSNDGEKAALIQAFGQIKQSYETEVAKVGKANNLAAAMTFFIIANVVAHQQTEMPADEASDGLLASLQSAMTGAPAFAQMTNMEKQQMHDWLVIMGGFVMTGYTDARQRGDAEALKTISQLAGYSMKLVLGIEVGQMNFAGNRLSLASENGGTAIVKSDESKIVGTWSKSASSPLSSNLVTNAGYYKGEYQFKPDGTYAFKAERWYGYLRAREFYTTVEAGTYSVDGDSLTITPQASKTTLRNPEGVVQKTENNQLEKATYRFQFHYFEGLNETQLVLQSLQETTRDGGFSSGDAFPNAYLYSPGKKLEWRF